VGQEFASKDIKRTKASEHAVNAIGFTLSININRFCCHYTLKAADSNTPSHRPFAATENQVHAKSSTRWYHEWYHPDAVDHYRLFRSRSFSRHCFA
jgi:hypothetical protein